MDCRECVLDLCSFDIVCGDVYVNTEFIALFESYQLRLYYRSGKVQKFTIETVVGQPIDFTLTGLRSGYYEIEFWAENEIQKFENYDRFGITLLDDITAIV
jgi:hypothetical protein